MYEIKIREGHDNGTELEFAEAVRLAMGTDERVARIMVALADPAEAGKALFGMSAEIYCRSIRYGEDSDARVQVSGAASHSPEIGMARAQAYMLASQIAAAANAAAAALRSAQQ